MSKEEIEAGNVLIAGFMGKRIKVINHSVCYNAMGEEYPLHVEVKYHSSWDWQIPVWSLVSHKIKEYIVGKEEYIIKQYFQWVGKYEEAIFCNDIIKGFNIIIEMLKWYNAQQPLTGNELEIKL